MRKTTKKLTVIPTASPQKTNYLKTNLLKQIKKIILFAVAKLLGFGVMSKTLSHKNETFIAK